MSAADRLTPLSLDARSIILENTNALNAINSGVASEKSPLKPEMPSISQFAHDEIGKSTALANKNPARAGMAPPSTTTDPLVTLTLAS